MPGAQERWDQLTEPSVRSQEATPPDLSRLADRPERGSLVDLRQRLERLPAGHPSSPYHDDLSRKLPVASLKDLELPLHGTERDLNGAAKHYEHGLPEGASPNGAGGRRRSTRPTGAVRPTPAASPGPRASARLTAPARRPTTTSSRPTTSARLTVSGQPRGSAKRTPATGMASQAT